MEKGGVNQPEMLPNVVIKPAETLAPPAISSP